MGEIAHILDGIFDLLILQVVSDNPFNFSLIAISLFEIIVPSVLGICIKGDGKLEKKKIILSSGLRQRPHFGN